MRFLSLLFAALLACTNVAAQGSATAGFSKVAASSNPTWAQLTDLQKEALQPLQDQWETFGPERKRKWLAMAARYPQLSPEGKQRFHERIPGYAKLTPDERETARNNFRKAYELPLEQRQSAVEQYKQLPEEEKQAMAAKSKSKKPAEPPRRVEKTSKPPVKNEAPTPSPAPSAR